MTGEPDPTRALAAVADLDAAAEVFVAESPRLVGLAYRLLGSLTDAEDVVQQAWLRWADADRSAIENPAAWLTTVVSRLGLDRLRSRARERASYVGPWLPEPLVEPLDLAAASQPPVTVAPGGPVDPADRAVLADSLTTAFLVLLERLTPEERLVILLVDVFGEPFRVAAEVIGRSEAATRQLAVRSRRKLRSGSTPDAASAVDPATDDVAGPTTAPARAVPADAEALRVATALLGAVALGDVDAALALLAPDVVLVSDGGPDRRAARRPVVGPHRVTRLLVNLTKRLPDGVELEPSLVNGEPGVVLREDGQPRTVLALGVGASGLVERVTVLVNPDKLVAVDRHLPLR